MMRLKKQRVPILPALTGLVFAAFLPCGLSAQEDFKVGEITYTVLDEAAKTVQTKAGIPAQGGTASSNGNNVTGDIVIPDKVSYGSTDYTVVAIGDCSFYNNEKATSFTLPNTVTSIGVSAFHSCVNVKSFTFNGTEKLATIGDYAFCHCSAITSFEVPGTVTSIGAHAFQSCEQLQSATLPPQSLTKINDYTFGLCKNLKSITIPEGVTVIGQYAFHDCNTLNTVSLPASLEYIDANAFKNCSSLNNITVAATVPPVFESSSFQNYSTERVAVPDNSLQAYLLTNWASFNNLMPASQQSSTDINDPESGLVYRRIAKDKLCVIKPIDKTVTSVDIPAYINIQEGNATKGLTVSLIAAGAFKNCTNLSTVDFPGYLEQVGEGAFEGCTKLTSLTFPGNNTFTTIGDRAFKDCTGLTTINFADLTHSIGNHAFQGCTNLKTFTFHYRLASIGDYAFADCTSIEIITLNHDLAHIGAGAFSGCTNLKTVTFNEALTEIPASAFQGCTAMSSFDMSSSKVTKIGDSAFQGCTKLLSVKFNDMLTEIGASAFKDCGLNDHLTLAPGLLTIGDNAFNNCNGVTAVSIPASVKSIGAGAFADCDYLAAFTIEDATTPIQLGADFYTRSGEQHPTMYIGRNWDYQGTNGIHNSIRTLTIGNLVTSIPANAFKQDTEITTLTLGSAVESIGDDAFNGCPLTEIVLPPAVKTIGANAFAGHHATNIYIGPNVTEIGEGAFNGVAKITNGVNISAKTPPTAPDENTFQDYTATLRVADMDSYKTSTSCWNKFSTIKEMTKVTEVTITNVNKLQTLQPGQSVKLTATVEPAGATMNKVFWRSTDPSYATVDNEGNVTLLQQSAEVATYADTGSDCRIIAETLDADAPVAEATFKNIITGIDEIGNNPGTGAEASRPNDIINLQGICIKHNATDADIRALRPGLYIIAGKKVLVK